MYSNIAGMGTSPVIKEELSSLRTSTSETSLWNGDKPNYKKRIVYFQIIKGYIGD